MESTWHRMVVKVSEETSFHGVKQISEPQRFVLRRVLWSLLVFGSGAILVLQIVLNIRSFISWPISVDIKINYNDSITFPAVTICNFNAFRATAAFEKGYYNLLSDLYSGEESLVNNISESSMNLTLDMLHRETGHRLEDLIVKCTWEGSPCKSSDFTVSLTKFGQCFTFNSGEDYNTLYKAVITGSSGGLSLQLNVEQYQYMNGPNEGAGLKVLVHQNDVDGQMGDRGLAIPPGSHAYVAAKVVEIHNIDPGRGKCIDSVKLEYHPFYTIENCYSECRQRNLVDKCGCREFHMPHIDGKPEVCTLGQHLTCGRQTMDDFSSADCYCPVPCDSRMYETISSHALTSNFDIESLLRSNLTNVLKEKFITSREINNQVDNNIRERFRHLVDDFYTRAQQLQNAMLIMDDALNETDHMINTMYRAVTKAADFHLNRGFDTVLQNLQENYIQVWENYKMQSFDILPTGYLELQSHIINTMNIFTRRAARFQDFTIYDGLSANATGQMIYRKLVVQPLEETLYAKLDVMELAFNHTRDILDHLDSPNPNPENIVTKHGRYDHTLNTVTILLHGVSRGEKNRIFNKMISLEIDMKKGIFDFLIFIRNYVEKAGRFKRYRVTSISVAYHSAEMGYNEQVHRIEENVVYMPYRAITDKKNAFEAAKKAVENLAAKLLRDVRMTKESLQKTYKHYWTFISQYMDKASKYLSDFQVRKTELAQRVTLNTTRLAVAEFDALLKDTRDHVTALQDGIDSLHKALKLQWVDLKTNPLTFGLYDSMSFDVKTFLSDDYILKNDLLLQMVVWIVGQGRNEEELTNRILREDLTKEELVEIVGKDVFLTPLSAIHDNLLWQQEEIRGKLDLMTNMTAYGGFFENAYKLLNEECALFLEDNIIGREFYRENLMRMDIYMQELRYEEITQQEAYSPIQLIGDMGGSMGLFVGGSLMSVIEVFDIFIHHCTKSLLKTA